MLYQSNLAATIIEKYFSLNVFLQSVFWFALILIVKHDTLLAPPFWDAAMGVFPPAIFLYESGFDIHRLIQQPDWWLGGANVHSFSLLTWFIAIIMSLTKSALATLISLHLITFCLTALALSAFVKCLDRFNVNRTLSFVTTLLLISTPLVLVQVGDIYNEIPVMCFSIFAFAALQNNKEWLSVSFAIIALSMKLTGVAIAVSIALVLLFRFISKPNQSRVWKLFLIGAFYIFFTSIYSWLGGIEQVHGLSWGSTDWLFRSLWNRASSIPEISIALCIGLIASLVVVVFSKLILKKLTANKSSNTQKLTYGPLLIPASFLTTFFAATIIATSQGYLFLPRYIIPMIPFALLSIVLVAQSLNLQTIASILVVIACSVNVFNHNGILYKPSTSFSIVERSHAYKEYSQNHKDLIVEISKLPNDIPIYLNREISYFTSHPMMGYLNAIKPNLIKFYLTENINKKAIDFPEEAYFAQSTYSKAHGGKRMHKLLAELRKHPNRKVKRVYSQKLGGIRMSLFHVSVKKV